MINVSAFAKSLNDKPVVVFGLGLSGLATVEALTQSSIKTYAWDDSADRREQAAAKGADIKEPDIDVLEECACLILSPGVPLTHPKPHPVVKAAHKAGTEIIGDIEILHRCDHGHTVIAITGTNGKSTTTALLTHVLNECGHSAQMGGNIGVPALALNDDPKDSIFVLEMSSYQIDLSPGFKPDIAVLLNITPDHIDRHGSFENYKAIKHRLLENAKTPINVENLKLPDAHFENLPGDHNKQNIAAVLAVCGEFNIPQDKALAAVKTFPGLPHRQFRVRQIGNISYINDSKATNAEAASKAISSYDEIYWIVGGQAKEGGLEGLETFKTRIKHAYLIGESSPAFALWMKMQGIEHTLCETLDNAVKTAHKSAHSSVTRHPSTVLLSPACASWDQFKSFEHRGDVFTQLVEDLDA